MILALAACWPAAASAVPVAPGYTVTPIATPGFATGDVVAAGGALFVGIGPFGVGTQSVVRIDGGGTTTIADGFNSLGGFHYDAANDRLIVVDNGLEAADFVGGSPALTGDTAYAIGSPFSTPGTPASALTLELAPSGTIPGGAQVLADPSDPDRLFVTDSTLQNLVELDAVLGTVSVLQSGLGFAAGLAEIGGTLFVGEVDATFFTGTIWTVPAASPGDPLSPFLSGLLGQFDLEAASDGSLLATSSSFFSGSEILSIDPVSGATTVVGTSTGFLTSLEEEAGTIYVMEDGVLYALAVPEPGVAALLACAGLALPALRRRS